MDFPLTAYIDEHFGGKRPYHVEEFPSGWCAICDTNGFNILRFREKPGAVFTFREHADYLCDEWNKGNA